MLCDKHAAPYKTHPEVAQNALLRMAQEIMYDKKFHGMCLGDTDNFARVIKVFAPVCCYLGDDVMRAIYAESGVL